MVPDTRINAFTPPIPLEVIVTDAIRTSGWITPDVRSGRRPGDTRTDHHHT
jgi:hypothetical protein